MYEAKKIEVFYVVGVVRLPDNRPTPLCLNNILSKKHESVFKTFQIKTMGVLKWT